MEGQDDRLTDYLLQLSSAGVLQYSQRLRISQSRHQKRSYTLEEVKL